MEGYCVWFTDSAMNKLLEAGFQCEEFRKKLSGSTKISVLGAAVYVTWEVIKAPKVSFDDINLKRESINEAGERLKIEDTMFTSTSVVRLGLKEGDNEIPLILVSNPILNSDRSVAFRMVGLQMDDSYEALDRAIIKGICPELLMTINSALGFGEGKTPRVFSLSFLSDLGITLPPQNGILRNLGKIGVWGGNGYMDFEPRRAMLSSDVAFVMTNGVYAEIITQWLLKHPVEAQERTFKVKTIIGELRVRVRARIAQIFSDEAKGDTVSIRISPKVEMEATGKYLVSDVQYRVIIVGGWLHTTVGLTIKNDHLVGKTEELDPFTVRLECEPRGWFNKLVEEALESTFEKAAQEAADSIRKHSKYNVDITIPDETIPTGISSLNVKVSDYQSYACEDVQNFYATLKVSVNEG